ncbi:hypothetical protein K437DRAFT_122424 [Tilletiaria anomala UBC 951]|uniref:Large ribosomal subunit protein bL21m n=1 Tax=Tilletiaria anomala (strain ATCC 24038 / CBS 436.72 / UBC 951) TaxID=1037660 RepID=A0A066W322_TILAU|nr:uncharacterized protein K437DRAFT_122424 [Tilletiaria anomala UBC 951]KDN45484.1 hypothetical protein K437DRAFT_122424 [Tilletiaria anomala UBC 951]
MRAAALRSTNSSLRAYAAGMPAKLGDLFNAGQSSLLGLIDVGSSHIGTDSQAEGAPQSIMQTAQALSLRQSRTSFGALVSSHGGLAHKGAVLPALIGAASTATTPSAERPLVQVEMTVLEHTKGPLERITKTKRRKGYKRTVQHKQGYTRLRVDAIKLVLP